MASGLAGKVALITGAGRARGIGRATALRLAAEGARVAVSDLCRRGEPDEAYEYESFQQLAAVAGEVEAAGSEGLAVRADVTSTTEVQALVAWVVERFGRIDILVNNAGLALIKPAVETTESEFRRCLDVMVLGTFLCSTAVAAHLLSRDNPGRIVNIASIHGLVGAAHQAAYCAAKFGVVGLTRSMALEWAPQGITVNAVCPGITDTDMMADISSVRSRMRAVPVEEVYARYASLVPTGRLGKPAEIANAVAFLASDDASYVTGHCLSVDGGFPG
jgi:NAD(P)-dependent dehydrogenase (short-subunit alcohol dehydrogenase family)